MSGSSFKWPSSENGSYSTCDSTTSHCSNHAYPVKCLKVGDAGGEFPSNKQKALFTALSPSVTTGADQASCSPRETPLGVMGPFTPDALFCFILGYAYCLLAATKIFSITFVFLKLYYAYINWLDQTVDLYMYAGERSKTKRKFYPKLVMKHQTHVSIKIRVMSSSALDSCTQHHIPPSQHHRGYPEMSIMRTQVTPLTLWSSHSADECLCGLPMHACKLARLPTPCWRTLLIFSQMLCRCTVLH